MNCLVKQEDMSENLKNVKEHLSYERIKDEGIDSKDKFDFCLINIKAEPGETTDSSIDIKFESDVLFPDIKNELNNSDKDSNAEEILQCPFCNIFLENGESLQYHMIYFCEKQSRKCVLPAETDHINGTLAVPHEELNFESSNSNQSTSNIIACDIKYNSTDTIYETNMEPNLKPYRFTCRYIKPFGCKICPKRYQTKHNLKVHIRDKHNESDEKTHACGKCRYRTNHMGNFNKHLRIHNDTQSDKEYKCDKCPFQTHYKNRLGVHEITRHADPFTEKKHRCSSCSYATQIKSNLNAHLRTHDPNKSKKGPQMK